jgi:two-component system response regulator MprA
MSIFVCKDNTRRFLMGHRILVIEDDKEISRLLEKALTFEGYEIDLAEDGSVGIALAEKLHPSVVILDLMLPGMDGIDVCRELKNVLNSPVLILTAKDQIMDKIKGLDAGADDYVVKPFDIEELFARIRALIRRTSIDKPQNLKFADLILDYKTRQAFRRDRKIPLTAKEFSLLEMFMSHPGEVITRSNVFKQIWGQTSIDSSNVLDVYIRYIRKKLEEGGDSKLIYTLRGVGYVMNEPE